MLEAAKPELPQDLYFALQAVRVIRNKILHSSYAPKPGDVQVVQGALEKFLDYLGFGVKPPERLPGPPPPLGAPPTAADFEREIRLIWADKESRGLRWVEIRAGDVHKQFDGRHNRMPTCCAVMRRLMKEADTIIQQPPKGAGANFVVRYHLPRRP